jgi:hypothetical protein
MNEQVVGRHEALPLPVYFFERIRGVLLGRHEALPLPVLFLRGGKADGD